MSVIDLDKVDVIYKGENKYGKPALVLAIIDHLEWGDVEEHIDTLIEKINLYIDYINTGEYKIDFEDYQFDSFVLHLYFMHKVQKNCREDLEDVLKELDEMRLEYKITEREPDDKMLKALEDRPINSRIIIRWEDRTIALCQIDSRYTQSQENDDFYNGIALTVKKVILRGKWRGFRKGDYIEITKRRRPLAIYTIYGRLLWKNRG